MTPAAKAYQQLNPIQQQELLKTLREVVFNALYPRVYQNIGHFNSPKKLAEEMAYLLTSIVCGLAAPYEMSRLIEPSLRHMAERKMPYFFVCRDFLEAIKKTDFTEKINWQTLKLPYEHGALVLPIGERFEFIFWGRLCPGQYGSIIPGIKLDVDFNQFSVFGKTAKNQWQVAYLDEKYNQISTDLRELSGKPILENATPVREGESIVIKSGISLEQDEGLSTELGRILFGTLLALSIRPDLLEPQKREKVVASREGAKEFWQPNLIGSKFRYKKVSESSGTHSSPRTHWRRGHFRNQVYGIARAEHKMIWIEPILVNAD